MDNQKLINRITLALLDIEKSEGVKIDFGFTSDYTGLKFNGQVKDRLALDRENALNLSICRRIGFTQNIIGLTFISAASGANFMITSIQPKNRKYPVIAENLTNGKSYKFSVNSVKRSLGGDQSINRFANLEKLTKDEE